MQSASRQFCILRVRPTFAQSEGPSSQRLHDLLKSIALGPVEVTRKDGFTLALDASPVDDELVNRLADSIRELLSVAPSLLIDFGQPRIAAGYAVPEWILFRALNAARRRFSPSHRVYVYLETLPDEGEQLSQLLPSATGSDQIQFVDSSAETQGTELGRPDVALALEDYLEGQVRGLASKLQERLVRLRGVFARYTPETRRHFRYQYHLPGEVAPRELSQLLMRYFQDYQISTIVYSDRAAPGWLEQSVAEAAGLLGLAWSDVRNLPVSADLVDPALRPAVDATRQNLTDTNERVCVVVPAYRDGLTHSEVESTLRSFGRTDFTVLAVILDEERAYTHQNPTEATDLWHGRAELGWGPARKKIVDYLCTAPVTPLEADDWMVSAARTMGEIQEMSTLHVEPTKIALWSLLCDYDVGEERPHPQSRPPVRWFPLLHDLDDWDAEWLISLVLRRVRERFDCQDNQILLIMPDEENASQPLARAVKRGVGGSIATVPRDALDGTSELDSETRQLIKDYEMLRIVAVDESTITGATLDRISALVESERRRRCDMQVAIFKAAQATHPDQIDALFSWRPYLKVAPA